MRTELLEQSSETSEEVTIDFAEVLSASYSFIDEFIGKLVELSASNAPTVINAPPMIAETIKRSLSRRGLDPDQVLASLEYA